MKVAAYCRVSTDHQDQASSLENQKNYFENYIKKNSDWQLVNIYADKGISGTQANKRPAFMKMIEDVNNREIELILTKEISRFARNTLDSLQYTRQLKSIGVGVLFINDNINTLDPDAELRLTIMSSIAQEEVRKTSERVKWGQKRRMEQGVVFGNGVFGYTLTNGQLTIKEDEAEIVRLIYHMFVNEGKGSHVIARELYEAGYESKYKSKWSNVNILNIIRNEKYVGDLLQKKYYTPNYLDHKKIINNNNEDMVYIKDHHKPIIDRYMWDKAQEELEMRSPSKDVIKKYSNRYWCSGKIKCGICGTRYIQKSYQRNYGVYRVWVCHSSFEYGWERKNLNCNNININYKILYACMKFIVNLILENINETLSILRNEVIAVRQSMNSINVNELEKKIRATKDKKEKLIELYASNVLAMDEVEELNVKYKHEISSYKESIRHFKDKQTIYNKDLDKVNEAFKNIAENYLTNEEIAEEIFKSFLEMIIVYKDCITVKLKNIPPTIRLYYETKGVKSRYETTIMRYEIE